MWQPYLLVFTEHFRVIVPDMRGHGQSDNAKGGMTYRQLADEIVAFMRALDLRNPLIAGFSDGDKSPWKLGCAIRTSRAPSSWEAPGPSS
jgi:pimeloyl-ACP methyl ester carboxylesterase